MSGAIAYINGEHVALQDARISILDRGFLFGDAVYEVIPVYAGNCYRLRPHIRRLQDSLAAISLPSPHNETGWAQLVNNLVGANDGGDTSVYLQVTRGQQPRREHQLPDTPQPNVVAFCQTRQVPDPALFKRGIHAVTMADSRWRHCAIKSTSLLANVLIADQARAQGAAEAILVRNGEVLEGSSSNVFAVIDGCITTPALRDTILAGITRSAILELARHHELAHAEVATLSPQQLAQAEEIWITSSTREIYPVARLNGAAVGNGAPGPVRARMATLLRDDTQV